MKLSRFSFEIEHDDVLLIFNCKTCGFARLTDETISQYRQLLKTPQLQKDPRFSSLVENLSKGGFLVEDTEDELETLRINEMMARFSTEALGLTIAPTLNCNFKCIYCYEMKPEIPHAMSEEVVKKLVDFLDRKLISARVFHTAWYGGEPLLAKKVIFSLSKSFIELSDKHECRYSAGMVSNCYLLDKSLAENLREECKIESVQATIDGPQEVHDKRRPLKNGKGSFQRIVENLKEICDIINVSIRINVDSKNAAHIPELLDFLSEQGLKKSCRMYFAQTFPYTEVCGNISEFCYSDQMYSKKEVELYKLALSKGFNVSKYPRPLHGYCGAISFGSLIVDPQGNFHKCWNTVGDEREIVGSLDQPEASAPKLRKWLSWNPYDFEECTTCTIFPICKGGCPYKGFEENRASHCDSWKYNLIEMLKIYYVSKSMRKSEEKK